MISDPHPLLESRELKGSYEPMNPFVSGVTRSTNMRVYTPMSRIEPYSQK